MDNLNSFLSRNTTSNKEDSRLPVLKWQSEAVTLGIGVKIYLTSALNENEWSACNTGRLHPEKKPQALAA
jgi:hypothetical protein